jgi:NCS2 family nucleobase:cation symporter-2
MLYWLNEIPPHAMTLGLALQHLAIQSIFFVIPTALAGSLSNDPGDATRFLCLSILSAAIWQFFQVIARGPIGSGYPIPATFSAALIGAYALTGAVGGSFGAAGAMLILTGVACVILSFCMHRLRVILPNEVAGVVVILIGVALVELANHRLGLNVGGKLPAMSTLMVFGASLSVMVLVALSRTKAAPFAVLVGAMVGVPIALLTGQLAPHADELLKAQPWLAVPQPWAPKFEEVSGTALASFLVALVALKASAVGNLVMVQRSTDAAWSRPDAAPIRRGLLANGLAIVVGGLMGGASPGPGTAAVGLSVATGTLARRVVLLGATLLILVSLCPKLVSMFVLIPESIKAAMLFYVAGFIMAQGCQMVTARLLDTRRTLIVAFGLVSGLSVAIAPHAITVALPALASPLTFGAMVAFTMNLLTLPMMSRKSSSTFAVAPYTGRQVTDWFAGVAASWALKPHTAISIEHALAEISDLLCEFKTDSVTIAANHAEDRVEVMLTWKGMALPSPAKFGNAEDLLGTDEARYKFSMWLATKHAHGLRQRKANDNNELWFAFED